MILDHCIASLPAEGCGLIALSGPQVVAVYPTDNASSSPDEFEVPAADHFRALTDAEDHGWMLGGSFHSHPQGEAAPSPRDVAGALEPNWAYLVVGMAAEPVIRAWRIVSGEVTEIRLY